MTLRLLTAGESHGPELVVIVEGVPAGVEVDFEELDRHLDRRRGGHGRGARSTKIEHDHAEIVSGVNQSRTTGSPVAIRIVNRDFANQPPDPVRLTSPRPGHADLAGAIKHGHSDFRLVRERASARETAARVAAAALIRPLLREFGISLGSFVVGIGRVKLRLELGSSTPKSLASLAAAAEPDPVRCPDPEISEQMVAAIDQAKEDRQTVGGTFVVFALGVPLGLGSYTHWDLRLDGRLAQAICSIPAIKGVEIGPGFELATLTGSQGQDSILSSRGKLVRGSNFAGGLEGGMSNGEPIVLRAAMKPLSSTRAPATSVDLRTGVAADPPYVRSDVCAVPAAAVVGEAMVGWVLAQALIERFGGDRLDSALAAARLVEAQPPPGARQ
ncbi:MAG TPA: chorismate synthase [Candidatus Dormibacteraeota bacterium]|nr:chorismate synthase [Candidatus Dormibacteraeota bacterium]